MPAVLFSLLGALMVGASVWLVLGNRLQLSAAGRGNDWFNLLAYALMALPFVVLLIFTVVAPI